MGVTFTKEQQQVIDTRNRNLLVSAAAGSGKTAVLVERIIQMILNKEHPVDIDRLLVVTFTNAAAAEMRERIRQAIDRELAVDPFNGHLQKQAALLHKAQITTIDSFCLFVIRNHFHEIGLDPGFRVADEGELKLLQQDTLMNCLSRNMMRQIQSFCSVWNILQGEATTGFSCNISKSYMTSQRAIPGRKTGFLAAWRIIKLRMWRN